MGAGGSKAKDSPRFADDFYGRDHKRLAAPLQRHFASGVKYNCTHRGRGPADTVYTKAFGPGLVKIVIRGDHCTGKSVLLKQLHRFSVTTAAAQSTTSSPLWFTVAAKPAAGRGPPPGAEGEGQPYVPTRQIQATNLTWKYKGMANGLE